MKVDLMFVLPELNFNWHVGFVVTLTTLMTVLLVLGRNVTEEVSSRKMFYFVTCLN